MLNDDEEVNKRKRRVKRLSDSDDDDLNDLTSALSQNSVKDKSDSEDEQHSPKRQRIDSNTDESINDAPSDDHQSDQLVDNEDEAPKTHQTAEIADNNSTENSNNNKMENALSDDTQSEQLGDIEDEVHETFHTQSSIGTQSNDTSPGRNQYEEERITELMRECDKRAYLDGRFFKVVPEETILNGHITAICQLCPQEKKFHATFRSPSNFYKHLQVLNNFKKYTKLILGQSD